MKSLASEPRTTVVQFQFFRQNRLHQGVIKEEWVLLIDNAVIIELF